MANDSPASIEFDIHGNALATTQLIMSGNNSTTIPLLAHQSFIGIGEEIISYQCVDVNLFGSPNDAAGTLYMEFSSDNVNWDTSIQLNLATLTAIPIPLRNILPYFRVRYINGSTDQTVFRLTVMYRRSPAKMITRFLSQTVDVNEPIEVTRSIVNAQHPDGSYNYLQTNSLGMLKVDATTPEIQTLYDMTSTTVNYIGTAPSGTATSAAAWTIKQITFDSNSNPVSILWSSNTAVWNNRLIEIYS